MLFIYLNIGKKTYLMTTKTSTKSLPAKSSSFSEAFGRTYLYISMVKIVDEELKIEVKDDIKAANITANIRPRTPTGSKLFTNFTKAIFVQPDLKIKYLEM